MTERVILLRAIDTSASTADAVAAIDDFHRWTAWSPFERLDTQMTRTFSGPERGVGSGYAWDGDRRAGAGSMKVTAVTGDKVVVLVNFLRPFKSESLSAFELTPSDAGTRITWRMSFEKTVVSRVMGLFFPYEKTLGPELEKGLANLKAVLEA